MFGNTRTKDMTQGSPLKLLISFTLPLLFGNAFQQLYSIVAMDPLASNYMQNEMRFSIMMKDVYEILGEAIGQGDIIPGVK